MFKWEEKTVKLKHFATAATIALSAVLSGAPAMAETVEEFYSANPVTLMVSAAPGGGADLYARAFAPFLSKYIPGHPNVVVTNVPGAGGLTAAAQLQNSAPRDGTMIAAAMGRSEDHLVKQNGKWLIQFRKLTVFTD